MATVINTADSMGPAFGSDSFIHKNQFNDTAPIRADAAVHTDSDVDSDIDSAADSDSAGGRHVHFRQLRHDVARLEGCLDSPRLSLGVDSLDSALAGGLALGRVHMLCGRPGHDGALTGFAAALVRRLAARSDGPVVWCPAAAMGGSGMLYAAGLAALGIDPGRLLIVDAPGPTRRLAAVEDILRTEGLAAVVVEYDGLNQSSDYWMRLARRAQLAAEASGTTGLLLGWPVAASGFESQWHISPGRRQEADTQSPATQSPATPWHPVWDIRITHARGGRPCHTGVLWDSFANRFQACALAGRVGQQTDTPAMLPFTACQEGDVAGLPRHVVRPRRRVTPSGRALSATGVAAARVNSARVNSVRTTSARTTSAGANSVGLARATIAR